MTAFSKLKDKASGVLVAISNEKYIVALKNGMAGYVPFTIIGAIILLIANFPSQHYLDFMASVFGKNWQQPLNDVMNGTMNIASIFIVGLIAFEMADHYKLRPNMPVLLSTGVYIYMCEFKTIGGQTAIVLSEFGAGNMIVAILLGIIVPEIYRFFMERHITIKLPDSVPPMVAQPFESLIPMAIVFAVFFVLRMLIGMTPYHYIAPLISGW